MKVFSFLLDLNLFYVSVLFASCIFLFSVFDIYYDRKKNLWHLNGPFPLPLVGNEGRLFLKFLFMFFMSLGNALLFAKPPEQFMPIVQAVSINYEMIVLTRSDRVECQESFTLPFSTAQLCLLNYHFKLVKRHGNHLRIHLGPRANAMISTPEGFEKVLSSNKHITKVKVYIFVNQTYS